MVINQLNKSTLILLINVFDGALVTVILVFATYVDFFEGMRLLYKNVLVLFRQNLFISSSNLLRDFKLLICRSDMTLNLALRTICFRVALFNFKFIITISMTGKIIFKRKPHFNKPLKILKVGFRTN